LGVVGEIALELLPVFWKARGVVVELEEKEIEASSVPEREKSIGVKKNFGVESIPRFKKEGLPYFAGDRRQSFPKKTSSTARASPIRFCSGAWLRITVSR
jgi:hypothetical protein